MDDMCLIIFQGAEQKGFAYNKRDDIVKLGQKFKIRFKGVLRP